VPLVSADIDGFGEFGEFIEMHQKGQHGPLITVQGTDATCHWILLCPLKSSPPFLLVKLNKHIYITTKTAVKTISRTRR